MVDQNTIIALEKGVLDMVKVAKAIDQLFTREVHENNGAVPTANRNVWCTLHVNVMDLNRKLDKLADKLDKKL